MPIYHINRVIKETGQDFDDGTFIVYVNTAHKDYSTALGKLIHDFRCDRPKNMYYDEIADEAKLIYVDKEGKFVKSAFERLKEFERTEVFEEGQTKASKELAATVKA